MNKKERLIYECAAHAVSEARLIITKLLWRHPGLIDHPVRNEVDTVLSAARRKAGEWAVKAFNTDVRSNPVLGQIIFDVEPNPGEHQALDDFLKKALIEEIAIKYQNAGMRFQQSRIHAETFVNDLITKFVRGAL